MASAEPGTGTRTAPAPRRIDADYDGYEDPDPGYMPDPGSIPPPEGVPDPTTDPGQFPPVDGVPLPPPPVTVSIANVFGAPSFTPNPVQAVVGDTLVWVNMDAINHDIVLDDGTPVGNLAPGQSSAPIPYTGMTAGYHCTLHPSMVGQIVAPVLPGEGVPADPSQVPLPDGTQAPIPDPYASPLPDGAQTPAPDPYASPYPGGGYDDGYEDDYYY